MDLDLGVELGSGSELQLGEFSLTRCGNGCCFMCVSCEGVGWVEGGCRRSEVVEGGRGEDAAWCLGERHGGHGGGF